MSRRANALGMWRTSAAALLVASTSSAAIPQNTTPVVLPSSLSANVRAPLASERESIRLAALSLQADQTQFGSRCGTVETGSAADARCKADAAILGRRRSDYFARVTRFNNSVRAALTAQIAALRAVIQSDQQAIRSLRIGKNVSQFDDWIYLSQYAAAERDRQVKEALRDAANTVVNSAANAALGKLIDGVGSLNPPLFYRLRTQLRGAGIVSEPIENLLKQIAFTPGKPEKARQAKELIGLLKKERSIWNLSDMTMDGDSAKWKAGSTILGLFVKDPKLALIGKLTLQEVRIVFHTVNANIDRRVALYQIEQLSALADSQLLSLKALSNQLSGDVSKLRAAKADLAKLPPP